MVRGQCIEWPKSRTDQGYGRRWYKGRKWLAHRAAWDEQVGPIPPGMCVLHWCDNPPCVWIGHLFLGTRADNNRDMASKGRHWEQSITHCPRGHEYTEANTQVLAGDRRDCRACRNARKRARRLADSQRALEGEQHVPAPAGSATL